MSGFCVPIVLSVLYLPTEAREEHLTVLVFVLQLLADADEAGADQRGIPYLQKRKLSVITQRCQPQGLDTARGARLIICRKTLRDPSRPRSNPFIALIP